MPSTSLLETPRRLFRSLLKRTALDLENAPPILNEALNFDTQSIFIAVPKTGTTTVRRQLRPEGNPMIPNPHLNIMQVRDALYVYLLRITLGQNESFPTQNVPTDAEIRLRSKEIFDTFFKFSSVRNPWARAVSLYSRREGVRMRDKLSFEKFCEHHMYASDTCRQPTLHKNQFDWLCDENGEIIMDYVYKVENFSAAIAEISHLTGGRVNLEFKEYNNNPLSNSNKYRDAYSDHSRKVIAKVFEKDIDFFKYTF